LLARLEDVQLRRIQRRNMLGEALEVMARVFEPYLSTEPARLGLGLGLSQVCGIASENGGSRRLPARDHAVSAAR
jgi:C4-dicarboxylate-specific signal transduction histidine kinase